MIYYLFFDLILVLAEKFKLFSFFCSVNKILVIYLYEGK
jgi:hypothetical protein